MLDEHRGGLKHAFLLARGEIPGLALPMSLPLNPVPGFQGQYLMRGKDIRRVGGILNHPIGRRAVRLGN